MSVSILCYGDSNTWGWNPDTRDRFPRDVRWTGYLQVLLDPIDGAHKNGLRALRLCLEMHKPLDLVILMLGTNDLKYRFSVTATDIAHSIVRLIDEIRRYPNGHDQGLQDILLLSPPPLGVLAPQFVERYMGAAQKAVQLADLYHTIAGEQQVAYIDTTQFLVSGLDGIHLDATGHKILAEHVHRYIIDRN